MKKLLSILFVCSVLLGSNSCQKKELSVKIIESACKDFKISNPSYTVLTTINCAALPLTWDTRITVNYSGKKDCIQKVIIASAFGDNKQNAINNVTYPTSILLSDPGVVVTDNTITFPYKFTFATVADANGFLVATLYIHIENEYGTKSNEVIQLIANACVPSSGQVVNTPTNTVTLQFADNDNDAEADNMTVYICLNGIWQVQKHVITQKNETFTLNVNSGSNTLSVLAYTDEKDEDIYVNINGTKVMTVHDSGGKAITVFY
jgi:hypothetical protein